MMEGQWNPKISFGSKEAKVMLMHANRDIFFFFQKSSIFAVSSANSCADSTHPVISTFFCWGNF